MASPKADAAPSNSHVAEFAWQFQRQGPPGSTSAAGAFSSPFSLYVALALALRGASGSSEQELFHALHQDKARLLGLMAPKAAEPGDVDALLRDTAALSASLARQAGNGCELVVANGVWSKGVALLPAYAAAVKELFGAEAQQVSGVEPINEWAARVTKGLIKMAVPPGTPFDLVLTNAVYFKGLWELSFDKDNTRPLPFHLEGGGTVEVPMMFKAFKNTERTSSRERAVRYADSAAFKAVRLPYKGCSISALAVLPPEAAVKRHGGLAAAVAELDIGQLLDDKGYHRVGPLGLELHMPKFTVKSECVSLKQHLQKMGIKAPFDEQTAKFEKLSAEPLFISDVLQSVCVIVDEEGTEAAAVTAAVMLRCSAIVMAEPPVIRLDRPFLFMLVDDATNTNVPLFMGTVNDPSK